MAPAVRALATCIESVEASTGEERRRRAVDGLVLAGELEAALADAALLSAGVMARVTDALASEALGRKVGLDGTSGCERRAARSSRPMQRGTVTITSPLARPTSRGTWRAPSSSGGSPIGSERGCSSGIGPRAATTPSLASRPGSSRTPSFTPRSLRSPAPRSTTRPSAPVSLLPPRATSRLRGRPVALACTNNVQDETSSAVHGASARGVRARRWPGATRRPLP